MTKISNGTLLHHIQGCFLGRYPLAKQWSELSVETLTASNRRTVSQGFQRALKALWSMGVQGESEVSH